MKKNQKRSGHLSQHGALSLYYLVNYFYIKACLEGFEYAAGSLPSIKDAMLFILQLIYSDSQKIEKPEFKTSEKRERNAEIYRRYLAGEDSVVLGRAYGLS